MCQKIVINRGEVDDDFCDYYIGDGLDEIITT